MGSVRMDCQDRRLGAQLQRRAACLDLSDRARLHRTTKPGTTKWLREERPDGAWVHDPAKPEIAIGFTPEWLEKTMADAGLSIDAIRYGAWSGRDDPVDFQDIVIASAGKR